MAGKLFLLTSLFCLIFILSNTNATIINVTESGPTIQAAINSAVNGDTILVSDGYYTGYYNYNISFKGKAVLVISENGPDNTLIDCAGASYYRRRGFNFISGEDSNSVLDGFMIINGWQPRGGAINCEFQSSPTVRNCIFQYNYASSAGGVVYTSDVSSPTFINCQFLDNSAGNYGGAVYSYTGDKTFINCVFKRNNLTEYNYPVAPQGGAIYCNSGSMILNFCLFSDNNISNAEEIGFGGAIYSMTSATKLENCTIVKNSAPVCGGIYFDEPFPKKADKTVDKEDIPSIEKCIIAYNTGGELLLGEIVFIYFIPDISCTDIYGFSGDNWPWPINDLDSCCDNFSLDPKFCDTSTNDFHLGTNSPCAPANSTCGIFGGVRIGVYGVGCGLVYICGDVNDDNLINIFDITYLISYLYMGGPDPLPDKEAGDMDGNNEIEIFDITYLIGYLYRSGPDPMCQR